MPIRSEQPMAMSGTTAATTATGVRSKASIAAPVASATDAAQGSNVREGFRLMATLIYPSIPPAYLDRCARILQRRHMETVFEERSVQSLCAFPACGNKLREKSAKYRVSLKKKAIYDASDENQYCSEQCRKKARVFVSRLVVKPPQLVPSLVDVFGTDKPNPFTWEKQQQEFQRQAAVNDQPSATRRAPQAITVWAKTADLGIIERAVPEPTALAALAATAPKITEHTDPGSPASDFPDATQAVLIEGFVFPSHKQSLAKKVERKWQQTSSTRGDEIVISDSEESEVDSEDDDDDGGSSVTSSAVDASDLDDSDEEDEEEIISSDDLPLFINMWRMLSTWVTHDTNLMVANKPLPPKPVAPPPKNPQEKKEREEAERATQLQFNERYNAFSLLLSRSLPSVAQQLALPCDRYPSQRIDAMVRSFVFRDAIDGQHTQQWACIAAVLLLVAHDLRVTTMTPDLLSKAKRVTLLDPHELQQLFDIFYALRDDSEIVVDEDVAAKPSDVDQQQATKLSNEPAVKPCRKCRRPQPKCVCAQKQAQPTPNAAVSQDELTQMFRDAVTLREHYEDLMEAAGGSAYDDVD